MANLGKGIISGGISAEPPSLALSGIGGLGARANLLAGLAGPLPLKNVYYKNKIVNLDGYRFEECRFDGCTLILYSTNFVLHKCVIDEGCVIQYGPAVVKVVQLFTSRYPSFAELLPGLSPVHHPDGTISIGA